MKILLIFPKPETQILGDAVVSLEQEFTPPLGLAYLASSLELGGHKVMVIDMYASQLTAYQIIFSARSFNPDVVGLTASTPLINSAYRIATHIKDILDIPVIIGGPHPSSLPEKTLDDYPNFDIAVRREGEGTMRELVDVLECESALSKVKGITWRNGGRIVSNPDRPLIENIDSIPFPAWHLLPMERYYAMKKVLATEGRKAFSMITSRGCPWDCKFCDSHIVWARKYRARSAANVVDEIEELYSKYRIRFITFWDDTFVVNRRHVIGICDEIRKRKLDIKWECFGRVNIVNKEVLAAMKKSGCTSVYYGIESGSQDTLNLINKGITLEEAEYAVRITKETGIKVSAFFMIGFPNETEEDVRKTIECNKKLPLDEHDTFSIVTPFPGTELYRTYKEEGLLLSEDWDLYWNRHAKNFVPPIRTKYLNAGDLKRLKEEGDKMMTLLNYKNKFWYLFFRPHKLLTRLMRDPNTFLQGGIWLLKAKLK